MLAPAGRIADAVGRMPRSGRLALALAGALLPARLGNRQRGVAGAITCAFALVMLIFMPMSSGWVLPMLAVAGLGLGIALMTVCLHLAGSGRAGPPDATAALAVLAAAAAAAALIAGTIRPLGSAAGRAHEMGPSGAFG